MDKMKPPFIPELKDDLDSSNFDTYELQNAWTPAEKKFLQRISTGVEERSKSGEKNGSVGELETEDQENTSK